MIANDLSNYQKQEDENESSSALDNSKTDNIVKKVIEPTIPTPLEQVVKDEKIDKKLDYDVDIKKEEVLSKKESKKEIRKDDNNNVNTTTVLVITGIAIVTIGLFAYLRYKK